MPPVCVISKEPGAYSVILTDVHEDNRVSGDMIAFICDIFSSDVRQADGEDRSEAEDLIK